jgi:lysophospholipid acyltransferase (LPLAT)-like uncharacterized protein
MSDVSPPSPKLKAKNRKVSGVVIPHSPRWYQRLAAGLIWLVATTVSATLRYRLHDPHGYLKRTDCPQVIYCVWHNRLALCVKFYQALCRRPAKTKGLAGLVSASKDGALLCAIFQCFNVLPVRGSSSRRGAQALLELASCAERGYDLAITPDGPRGPRYVLSDGAITLAQLTGLPIVTVAYHLNWKLTLRSWDRFQIPLPFARCEFVVGKVFPVPRRISPEEREKLRQEIEAELRAITRD